MAVLYGKKPGSRYNFRDDILMLLGWLEELREPTDETDGKMQVCGTVDMDQMNRVRGAAGMAALVPTKGGE